MLSTAIAIAAAAYLFLGLLVLAPRKPGYRHARHTISELGEIGAPDQRLVAFGLFLPVGVLLALTAMLSRAASPPLAALALCVAVGYLGAALFPCDPGSPMSGSSRQAVHNLAGAVEYIGGGFALMVLAEGLGQPFRLAGFIVLGATIALSLPGTPLRGLVQRVAETCLFGGIVLAAWRLVASI